MSAIERAREKQYEGSKYAPTSSIGTLSCIDMALIVKQKNLEALEQLSNFCEHMQLNPVWYQHESSANKAKLLQVYQCSLNYSFHLRRLYEGKQKSQEQFNSAVKEKIALKKEQMRAHKRKVEALKAQYRQTRILNSREIHAHYLRKIEMLKGEQGELEKMREEMERKTKEVEGIHREQVPPQTQVIYYYPHPMENMQQGPLNPSLVQSPLQRGNFDAGYMAGTAHNPNQGEQIAQGMMKFLNPNSQARPNSNSSISPGSVSLQPSKFNKNSVEMIDDYNKEQGATGKGKQHDGEELFSPVNRLQVDSQSRSRAEKKNVYAESIQNSSINLDQGQSDDSFLGQLSEHSRHEQINSLERSKRKLRKGSDQVRSTNEKVDNTNHSIEEEEKDQVVDLDPAFSFVNKIIKGPSSRVLHKDSNSSISSPMSAIGSEDSFFDKKLSLDSKIDRQPGLLESKEGLKASNQGDLFPKDQIRRRDKNQLGHSTASKESEYELHDTTTFNLKRTDNGSSQRSEDRLSMSTSNSRLGGSKKPLKHRQGSGLSLSSTDEKDREGLLVSRDGVKDDVGVSGSGLLTEDMKRKSEPGAKSELEVSRGALSDSSGGFDFPDIHDHSKVLRNSKALKKSLPPSEIKEASEQDEVSQHEIPSSNTGKSQEPGSAISEHPKLEKDPINEDNEYDDDFEDDGLGDLGLQEKSKIERENSEGRKSSFSKSRIQIDVSMHSINENEKNPQESPFCQLSNGRFELQALSGQSKESPQPSKGLLFASSSNLGSLKELSALGNSQQSELPSLGFQTEQNGENEDLDFLQDIDIGMKSIVGKRPPKSKIGRSAGRTKTEQSRESQKITDSKDSAGDINIRVLNNSGSIMASHEHQNIPNTEGSSHVSDPRKSELNSLEEESGNFLTIQASLESLSAQEKVNRRQSGRLPIPFTTQSHTFSHGQILANSNASSLSDTKGSQNTSSPEFLSIGNTLKSKPPHQSHLSELPNQEEIEEDIDRGLDPSHNSTFLNFEKHEIERKMLGMIRTKFATSKKLSQKTQNEIVQNELQDVISEKSGKDPRKVKDWKQVAKVFEGQIEKIKSKKKKMHEGVCEDKLKKLEALILQEKKQSEKAKGQSDANAQQGGDKSPKEDFGEDLFQLSNSIIPDMKKLKSDQKANGVQDAIKEEEEELVIELKEEQSSGIERKGEGPLSVPKKSESETLKDSFGAFDLKEDSRIVSRPKSALPEELAESIEIQDVNRVVGRETQNAFSSKDQGTVRPNSLISPGVVPEVSTQQSRSISKYAVGIKEKSASEGVNETDKSLSKQKAISRPEQNKYDLDDPLTKDIGKGGIQGLIADKSKAGEEEDYEDDFEE